MMPKEKIHVHFRNKVTFLKQGQEWVPMKI